MNILLSIITIIICFYGMSRVINGYFIKSLDGISDWLNLTPSVAGATLMALGTSAPELGTALIALFTANTSPTTGLGSSVGSALFQTLVVIGFTAIISSTKLDWKNVMRDATTYGIAIVLLIIFVSDGKFTVVEASLMIITYLTYLVVLFFWSSHVHEPHVDGPLDIIEEGIVKMERETTKFEKMTKTITFPIDFFIDLIPNPNKRPKWTIPVFILSLLLIGVFSYGLVISAETFAHVIGVPTSVIALTILAGGGSLPELVGSTIVAKQNRGEMAISNVLGSNTFDILISLGLPLFIYTMINGDLTEIGDPNIHTSIFLLFATLAAVIILLIIQKFEGHKWFGFLLIGMYIFYVVATFMGIV